jgi:hypothetical protein
LRATNVGDLIPGAIFAPALEEIARGGLQIKIAVNAECRIRKSGTQVPLSTVTTIERANRRCPSSVGLGPIEVAVNSIDIKVAVLAGALVVGW